ncbi:MAG: flagellar hook-length control protein FliK, partial [Candidatus Saccharibacteria bacterium]|nr:flagellar hook-length control protein FliK [Pseudorhodobacter sp.]
AAVSTRPPDHHTEARRLPHDLAPSIARAATRPDHDHQVELSLDPVELGKLRFEFTTTNDRIQVNLSVERSDTLDLLRRHADVLRAEFRDAGLDASTLSFSQWAQKGRDDAPQPLWPEGEADLPPSPPPEAAPRRNLTTAGQGLDLRL